MSLDFPRRLELERPCAPLLIQVDGQERYPNCQAKLEDDGVKQSVPVCMGGAAIIGCISYESCSEIYGERVEHDGYVHVFFRDEDTGRIKQVATVRRLGRTAS